MKASPSQETEQKKSTVDRGLLVTVLILVSIGLLMILSASSIRAIQDYNDAYFFFRRQLSFAGIGLLCMLFFSRIDYHNYLKHSRKIVLIALFLLIIVLIPGVGQTAGGSRRWLDLGFFNFQTSEFAKLAVAIYVSSFISRKDDRIKTLVRGVIPPMIVVSSMFLLIALQPDFGTAFTIFAAAILMLIVGGIRIFHLGVVGTPVVIFMFYYITSATYRMNRVLTFFDPWRDPRGSGYHIIQSLMALGTGGLLGVGPGNSRQKFLYLPEPGTDFIFAIIGEEMGLLGAAAVIILFGYLAYRGIRISLDAPDVFGSLLASGLIIIIIIQTFINIAAVTNIMPVTGITLPFISYGGSSLLMMMTAAGILLNISRHRKR